MLKSDQTDKDLYRLALYPRYHSGMRKMYFLTFCFTYFFTLSLYFLAFYVHNYSDYMSGSLVTHSLCLNASCETLTE